MRQEFFRLCGDLGWTDGRDSGPFLCRSGDVIVIKALGVTDTPDLEGVVARAEARAKMSLDAYAASQSSDDKCTSTRSRVDYEPPQQSDDEDGEDVSMARHIYKTGR